MSTPAGARVEIRGVVLRHAHAERAALDDVSLDIAPGELLVILGPSGCGKSTLLRTINRLIVPQAGTIFFDGRDIAKVDAIALRRSIGYVIQLAGLFPHLRVRDNVGFVPSLQRRPKAEIDARVDELLALVRLAPARYRDRAPVSLSGGEAQRVGVARALAARPRLLLMDEPFGALDPVVRRTLQAEVRKIIAHAGTTTVFVTHDVDEALALADRIVVMDQGTILQQAAPLAMLRAPADARVANLLGTESLVRRLSLVPVTAALQAGRPDPMLPELELPHDATLDQALNVLLAHPSEPIYRVADRGTLSFADLARAIATAPPNA